jgi:hypothetical protein
MVDRVVRLGTLCLFAFEEAARGTFMLALQLAEVDWNLMAAFAVIIAAPLVLVAVFVWVLPAVRRAHQKMEHMYDEFDFTKKPQPGTVKITFHTYFGFINHFTQTEHKGYLPPDQARELLRRLHRYNLTHNWLTPGAVFIPFLSFFNYHAQLRSVNRQEAKLETDAPVRRRKKRPVEPT